MKIYRNFNEMAAQRNSWDALGGIVIGKPRNPRVKSFAQTQEMASAKNENYEVAQVWRDFQNGNIHALAITHLNNGDWEILACVQPEKIL